MPHCCASSCTACRVPDTSLVGFRESGHADGLFLNFAGSRLVQVRVRRIRMQSLQLYVTAAKRAA